jgi:molecular chaperone DnaK (HSP70)
MKRMQDYLVSSIKRLYDDCYRALERENAGSVGDALVDRYNELLNEIQEEYPDEPRIQNLDAVEESGWGGRAMATDVQEVKIGVTSIADSLGLDSEDFQHVDDASEIPIIQINNQQSQSQSQQQQQDQYITIEEINQEADRLMASPDEKKQIKEQIEEFESELEGEEPDTDRIINIISIVRDTSTQLASKLAMRALQHGVDILNSI